MLYSVILLLKLYILLIINHGSAISQQQLIEKLRQ